MKDGLRDLPKTYAKGARNFIGFEPPKVQSLLKGFASRVLGPPDIRVVQNARLMPLTRVAKGIFTGGVATGADYLDFLSLHRGIGKKRLQRVTAPAGFASQKILRHLDRAWFGGYLFSHYGHFLLEGLSRILSSEVIASPDPIVFFNPMRIDDLKDYMKAVFRRAGIDPARIVLCDVPTSCSELMVQDVTFEISGFIRPSLYKTLKRPSTAEPHIPMLYHSRSRLARKRTIVGEAVLEESLRNLFKAEIMYPENVGQEEKIEKYGAALCLAGCEGSGFHTLMFVDRVPRVVMLCNDIPHMNYILFDELFDGDVFYVKCPASQNATDNRVSWVLSPEKALAALEAIL